MNVNDRLVAEFALLQSICIRNENFCTLVAAREPDVVSLNPERVQLVRPFLHRKTRPSWRAENVEVRQVRLDSCGELQRACHATPSLGERAVVHFARILDSESRELRPALLSSCSGTRTHGVAAAHHVPACRLILAHLLRETRHRCLRRYELGVEEISHDRRA